MTTASHFSLPQAPLKKHPVRELLILAGVDVSAWAFTKDGEEVENPNDNIGRNTNWSFVGEEGEPIVLCVWYRSVNWASNPPVYRGNEYVFEKKLIALAGTKKGKDGLSRLKAKMKQARQFHRAVYKAKCENREIKLILVEGEQVPIEEAAERSSKVRARSVDLTSWFVHEFDGMTGDFLLVRGVKPVRNEDDPYAEIVDPGEDPDLQAFIEELDETEREALIKARVGQGPFRDALIDRWRSCSVTECALTEILIASHIKPWSKCDTPAERLGPANGLLLIPNLDKLFDRGLISFDDNLRIIFSPLLKEGVATQLNVNKNMRIRRNSFSDMLPFLAWHREHILKK